MATKKRVIPPPTSHIRYVSESEDFTLKHKSKLTVWLSSIASKHNRNIGTLNYCFVSDDHLLALNKHYLRHNTLTDIITFDYSSDEQRKNVVSGEIYISIDRVKENAEKFGSGFVDELHRVMAHGLLHLCGLRDKSAAEIKQMRNAEEKALVLRHF